MKRRVRLIEIWKPVVGFEEHYAVSNHGRVMRTKKSSGATGGLILKPIKYRDGYHLVHLYKEGKRRKKYIHRLVIETFLGPCPPRHECNHICKSGDKTKNYLWNLEWITCSENIIHKHDVLGKQVKTWVIIYPSGKRRFVKNLSKFCKIRKLQYGNMIKVAKGQRKHAKGWKCLYY